MRFLFVFLTIFLTQTAFAEDSLICSGKSKDGLKEGVWLCKKGEKIYRKERYKKGVLQTYLIYDEKGRIIETRNRKGKVKKYTPCGC